MNKKLLLFVSLSLLISLVSEAGTRISPKFAYFRPCCGNVRDIYGGGLIYGGEIDISITKSLDFWIGGMYFSKKGIISSTQEETKIKLFPIEGGLKFKLPAETFVPYIGGGLGYFQFEESSASKKSKDRNLGYCVQFGLLIPSCTKGCGVGITIDLFLNYSYCKVKSQETKLNVGGIKAGIGWGFAF
ncbi:MAG: hypothetical protein ACETWK_09685 [Candidatus Aminicenantaceae bacterium]